MSVIRVAVELGLPKLPHGSNPNGEASNGFDVGRPDGHTSNWEGGMGNRESVALSSMRAIADANIEDREGEVGDGGEGVGRRSVTVT